MGIIEIIDSDYVGRITIFMPTVWIFAKGEQIVQLLLLLFVIFGHSDHLSIRGFSSTTL